MKWPFVAWSALLAVTMTAVAANAAPQTNAGLSEIAAALTSGRAAEAERLADAVLAESDIAPLDRARALADRGAARETQGKHEAALNDLTRAVGTRGVPPAEMANAFFMRGTILDAQGKLNDAISDYGATLKLQPHFAPAFNNRANAYRRQNRFADARRDYLASLAAGNAQPEYSYFGLGRIEEAEGRTEPARGFYARSVAANPAYQLAAARLAALGRPPDGAVADSGALHLRPPKSVVEAEGKIILRPPGSRASQETPTTAVRYRVAQVSVPRTAPARHGPGLRPALDAGPGKSNEAAAPSGPQVQLGAWRTQAEADTGWSRAQGRAKGLLDGLKPHIVPVDLPGRGRFWRLRVGLVQGGAACAALQAKGVECMAVRD